MSNKAIPTIKTQVSGLEALKLGQARTTLKSISTSAIDWLSINIFQALHRESPLTMMPTMAGSANQPPTTRAVS
jgi:hypothetical protein